MKKTFTFKTVKPTGKWRSFEHDEHLIKLNGREVGYITDDAPHKIAFQVEKADINEDGNPNSPWRWRGLKKRFDSVQEAKDFILANTTTILEKFKIWEEPKHPYIQREGKVIIKTNPEKEMSEEDFAKAAFELEQYLNNDVANYVYQHFKLAIRFHL